ncbi:MAG: SRPBCC domain-containing protein [Calditrichaeota bacterium]|nr:SRPBCC domain-containing protein [Calditrichota bacterium]MCB9369709.1 SRPBCC domain-containing protein [Calditrichota bacterium]
MAVYKLVEGERRSIVGEFEFDLPVETVWAALTDPNQIANWFCFRARVEGKVGGEIEFDWKPFFDFNWIDNISVWEPNKRLTFVPKPETLSKDKSIAYTCDFVIKSDKGKTTLRMVQSGFTTAAKWDDEFDSFFGGWTYELYSLSHYLTYHYGKKRSMLKTSTMFDSAESEKPYERIVHAEGLFEGKTLSELKVGGRYKVKLSDKDTIEGVVVQAQPHGMDQFAGTVENWNNGLFRIGSGSKFCFTWLALYDYKDQDVVHLEPLLKKKFEQALAVTA